mmetsp:Transcript_136386/g.423794  ORF Transcript_136386/g.423794 Transcript_136386/m.423794 type:complete len:209 (-) Transcript_136386:229-855(-)
MAVAHLLPVGSLEVDLCEEGDGNDHDERQDGHRLDPVRHDGGGEAPNHGVDHGEERDGDDAPLRLLAVELERHVAHRLQLADQVNEHVVDEHNGDVGLRHAAEAVPHPVGDVGAVRQLLAELAGQDGHDQRPEEDGHRVADHAPPPRVVGGLPRRVEEPSARRGGADAQGDAPPGLRVPRAVPEVRRARALRHAPDVRHRQGSRQGER